MARETKKATFRRLAEHDAGGFPWRAVFKGRILDIGAGDDPLAMDDVTPFDKDQGDCSDLTKYFAPETWDTLHSSNCLEHLHDARKSIESWINVLKTGGHLIFTVPECVLYGDMLWKKGPMFNGDHKATFSMWLRGSPAPKHYLIPEWMKTLEKELRIECLMNRLVDDNYNYGVMFSRDQTWVFEDGVECFCECVLRKK